MAHARLYLDEDVYRGVAIGLRRRGFDVLTTVEGDRQGSSDEAQLNFAASQGRAIFTFNRGDFARLHGLLVGAGMHHNGVIVAPQLEVGAVVRMLARVLSEHRATDLCDRLVWLKPR